MGILSIITAKDIFLLIMGGIVGYLINLIVAAQTAKKKKLIVELIGREIKLDERTDYPYTMRDNDTGEVLENCYCIYIMIWNKGNLEIKNSDIDLKNPLTISIDSTAIVIGKPRDSFKNEYIDFKIEEIESNRYQIGFNCLNPKEGIELEFYLTGNAWASFNIKGNIYGGESQLVVATDDDFLTGYERLSALLAIIIYLSIPLSLIIGLIWWFTSDYSLLQIIQEPELIPNGLEFFLLASVCFSVLIIISLTLPSIKRKQFPKNYPIEEDYIPNIFQSIRIYWTAAITGRKSMTEKIISNE